MNFKQYQSHSPSLLASRKVLVPCPGGWSTISKGGELKSNDLSLGDEIVVIVVVGWDIRYPIHLLTCTFSKCQFGIFGGINTVRHNSDRGINTFLVYWSLPKLTVIIKAPRNHRVKYIFSLEQ